MAYANTTKVILVLCMLSMYMCLDTHLWGASFLPIFDSEKHRKGCMQGTRMASTPAVYLCELLCIYLLYENTILRCIQMRIFTYSSVLECVGIDEYFDMEMFWLCLFSLVRTSKMCCVIIFRRILVFLLVDSENNFNIYTRLFRSQVKCDTQRYGAKEKPVPVWDQCTRYVYTNTYCYFPTCRLGIVYCYIMETQIPLYFRRSLSGSGNKNAMLPITPLRSDVSEPTQRTATVQTGCYQDSGCVDVMTDIYTSGRRTHRVISILFCGLEAVSYMFYGSLCVCTFRCRLLSDCDIADHILPYVFCDIFVMCTNVNLKPGLPF